MMSFIGAIALAVVLSTPSTDVTPVPAKIGPKKPNPAQVQPPSQAQPNILELLLGSIEEEEKIEAKCEKGKPCFSKTKLVGSVNERTTQKVIRWIEAWNKAGATQLLLEINSPGGSVDDGFLLAKAIEESNAPITCVVDGEGHSMAFYILQSCHKRIMTKRSIIMAHQPSIGLGGFRGTQDDYKNLSEMLRTMHEAMAEHNVARMSCSLEEYKSRTNGSLMWFMNHRDATKWGAVDEIVSKVKDVERRLKD